jgi:hypothetical protein
MPNTDDWANFREVVLEFLREKELSLPSIPESPHRQAYLDFISMWGYSEDEILPIFDRSKVTSEGAGALLMDLIKAAESEDSNFVRAISWIALNTVSGRDNTNLLIHDMSANLVTDVQRTTGKRIPDFYAGVFPTDSCNAQATVFNSENLILIDTGYMETLEAATIALMVKNPWKKVEQLGEAIDSYVNHRVRPDPTAFDATGIKVGSGIVSLLVTAAEESVIAHELGHLSLGHVKDQGSRRVHSQSSQEVLLADKSQAQELQADAWALDTLLKRALGTGKNPDDIGGRRANAVGGMSIALGSAFLIECARHKYHIEQDNTHPPAAERMYMIEMLCALLGVSDDTYVLGRFKELVEKCRASFFPEYDMSLYSVPPFLHRELNSRILPVFRSLGIDTAGITGSPR